MQVFQNLPWWAKAISVFVIIVCGVAVHDISQNNPKLLNAFFNQNADDSGDSSLENVNITVLNRKDSQPIENVRIQVIFDGPPISRMTDRNGYFEIQIPTRKTAQVTLTKEGFKTASEIVNLKADPKTTRILYLDPGTSK